MKRLILLLLFAVPCMAQTHTFCASDTNCVYTGNNTFSGSATFQGINLFKNAEGIRYADQFAGADIGAQINAAYADLPTPGGTIYLACQTSGARYDYTTPIVMATSNKYAVLQGLCPSNQSNLTGVTLNYTPTTATTALTIDWTPLAGGGWAVGAGLRDINLINNSCMTNGGCGSSATGIAIGNSNGGAEFGYFENVSVAGFGVGVKAAGTFVNVSYGMNWVNHTAKCNTTGWSIGAGVNFESLHFMGGMFANNGTGFTDAGGAQVEFIGTGFDSNTVMGLASTAGSIFNFFNPHFENNGGTTANYITTNSAGTVIIHGGLALDDVAVGNINNWFNVGIIDVKGLTVFSSGRTTTSLFVIAAESNISVIVGSPAVLTFNTLGAPQSGNGTYNITSSVLGTLPPTIGSFVYDFSEMAAPVGVASKERLYGDSTSHTLKGNYNNSSYFDMTQTIGTGTTTTAGTLIAAGTCQAEPNITVTGAASTDMVIPNIGPAFPASWQTGINFVAHIVVANTITVYLCNPTAAGITPAATSVFVRVIR